MSVRLMAGTLTPVLGSGLASGMLATLMGLVHRAVNPKPHRDGATAPQVAGEYPDKLDARLLRIAGVCVLASIMAILDATVVSVAQRTFIRDFGSTQAVVAWTMTGYTLGQATVIPLAGWASDRVASKRRLSCAVFWFTLGSSLC